MTSARPIGDLVTIVGGGTPTRTKAEFYGGGVPWVTPKDMKTWDITESQVMLTEDGVNQSPAKVIEPNAVLVVVRSGILRHTLPIAVNRVPVTLNQDMKALICEPGLHPDYLARYLKWRAPEILDRVRATTADNFPVATLRQLEIPVPALQEQRRVAAILDQADRLQGLRRVVLAGFRELRCSLFRSLFDADSSSRWSSVALSDALAEGLRNGISPSNDGTVAGHVLTLSAVTGGRFDATAVKDASFSVPVPAGQCVQAGLVLICRGNGNRSLVGRAVISALDMPGVAYPDTVIAGRLSTEVEPQYFLEEWDA